MRLESVRSDILYIRDLWIIIKQARWHIQRMSVTGWTQHTKYKTQNIRNDLVTILHTSSALPQKTRNRSIPSLNQQHHMSVTWTVLGSACRCHLQLHLPHINWNEMPYFIQPHPCNTSVLVEGIKEQILLHRRNIFSHHSFLIHSCGRQAV